MTNNLVLPGNLKGPGDFLADLYDILPAGAQLSVLVIFLDRDKEIGVHTRGTMAILHAGEYTEAPSFVV